MDAVEWLYVRRSAKNPQLYTDDKGFAFEELGVQPGECMGVLSTLFTLQGYGPVLAIADRVLT